VRIVARRQDSETTAGTLRAALITSERPLSSGVDARCSGRRQRRAEALFEHYLDDHGLWDDYNEGAGSDALYVSSIDLVRRGVTAGSSPRRFDGSATP
jgi:hypothetical protein